MDSEGVKHLSDFKYELSNHPNHSDAGTSWELIEN